MLGDSINMMDVGSGPHQIHRVTQISFSNHHLNTSHRFFDNVARPFGCYLVEKNPSYISVYFAFWIEPTTRLSATPHSLGNFYTLSLNRIRIPLLVLFVNKLYIPDTRHTPTFQLT
ncbi:hypothetical protein CC2G_008318 [Coprinopsis cinerea AmutBmut pab1-1]|nr:hypothetical protein CC2G_008318 [Coprinopsis cinerea AmutBmut pab1-1]